MGWRDPEWASSEHDEVTSNDQTRTIVWGALAVFLLGVAGVLLTFLQ
ncbi:MAG: hypothetical protein QOF43_561 [Gaiellaceae bacterium]|jgi:hypothetical protein|nr:hypothetical protein [Gaiellaceae bacterium]